jgi:hypothetical protein
MFEITITAPTMQELAVSIAQLAATYGDQPFAAAVPASKSKTKPKVAPAPEQEEEVNIDAASADAELRAAIAADERTVQPMPDTAKGLVDAGTGKVADPVKDEPIKMTMDDVKAAAAKLAAKDTPKLAEILKKYKAGKLSEVKGTDMGDFAADVMAELG